MKHFPLLFPCLLGVCSVASAATIQVAPATPQPGDVLTVTIYPQNGETISGIGMAAFDTKQVKFFTKPDGAVRAFVGLPFDRTGGNFALAARVQTNKGEQILKTTVAARARAFPTQRITMNNRATAAKMDNKAGLRNEKLHMQAKMQNSAPEALWNGAWVLPCRGNNVSSAYGRKRYVNGKWWGQHNGSDVKAPSGTPVIAANAGRVALSEYLPALRGNCIVIDHGCNIFSIYMHLSKFDVREGQSVGKGQQIGRVGATGFVTGPHLHWEVRVGWEPVDPNKIVRTGLKF